MGKSRYAMVCINGKPSEKEGEAFIRRVLIRYGSYDGSVFNDTAFVDKDEYFCNKESSHTYVFKDDCYSLESTRFVSEETLVGQKRPYHFTASFAYFLGIDVERTRPILFEADNDEEARIIFSARKELR